jgi:ribosomal protein S18 acetylase RimI-like enzyme
MSTTMKLFLLLTALTTTCRAFVVITPTTPRAVVSSYTSSRLFSTTAEGVSISPIESEADLQKAAAFMVDAFWFNSPQGLVVDGDAVSDSAKKSLIQEQADDFQDKYGERMGKRALDTMLIQAIDSTTNEIVGLVGLEVSLLDKDIGDTLSTTKSEALLKTAVASLGPKERRQYKSATADEIATELLPPHLTAVAVLSNLVVSPTARRRGIANTLCAQVEGIASSTDDNAKKWGYDALYLRVEKDNEAARTLYETKLGFAEKYALPGATGVRVKDGSFSEVKADILVLCKDLQ